MRVRFHHSLAGRLVLFGVLPTLVLVGSLVVVGLAEKYRTLQAMVEQQLTSAVQLAAAKAEDRLNDAARSARIVAEVIGAEAGGDPTTAALALQRILDRDPVVSAMWVAFEPDVIDAAKLDPELASLVRNGRFVPRASRDLARGGRAVLGARDLAIGADAIERPLAAFEERGAIECCFGDPLLRDGEEIVEISYPIVVGNRAIGVAGAEYSIRDIESAWNSYASEFDMQIFAISPSGVIVTASVDSRADGAGRERLGGKRVDETPYAASLAPVLSPAAPAGVLTDSDPVSGRESYLVGESLRSGGWRVVLLKPVDEIMRPAYATVVRNLAFAVIGLGFLATLLVALAVSVRRRIDRAVRAAERIAQGDLTVRLATDGHKDEAGALLETLGVMAERLSVLIARVQTAGRTLDASVVDLGKSTATQRSAATPLGTTTTEVAAAAKQISATGVELARTMESVQVNAAATADLAKRGREQLAAVDGSMRELDTATVSVAGKLATINERAIAINTVVTTITKVADQTNLLSVNAAIEAEKAGEQGRGFLVVAREIRRLADQTAGSSLDIARLVEEMQSAVSAGVMEMDRFAEKVRRSVEDVNETSRQMGAIIGQVAENTERFRAVTEGMASQSAGAVQISDATAQIQQSARAAIDGLARLSATARAIEGATGALHSEVSAFRITSAAA